MADFSLPVLGSAYADVLTYLKDRDVNAITLCYADPANIPAQSMKWNRAGSKFQEYVSSAWEDKVLAIAGGGTGGATAAAARTALGLGTMAVQDNNNVNITGGTITSATNLSATGLTSGTIPNARYDTTISITAGIGIGGTAGSTNNLRLYGSTSGYTSVVAPAVAGTQSITLGTTSIFNIITTAAGLYVGVVAQGGYTAYFQDANGRVGFGVTTGTNAVYIDFTNTGGTMYFGMSDSAGTSIISSGGTAYSTVIRSGATRDIQFAPGGTLAVTLSTSANIFVLDVQSKTGFQVTYSDGSRSGLYTAYHRVLGSGTDRSTGLFAETGFGLFFAVNGSSVKTLSISSAGLSAFADAVSVQGPASGYAFKIIGRVTANQSYFAFHSNADAIQSYIQSDSTDGLTISQVTNLGMSFYTNNTLRVTISAAGLATFAGAATVTGAFIAISTITATTKGNQFGSASGGTTALARTDANILLYNNDTSNWAGIGTDNQGGIWFRTGISGTPDARAYIDNVGVITFYSTLSVVGVLTTTVALVVGTSITSGSGAVAITDSTGKLAAFTSTFYQNLSGANFTALNASNISSGTLANARLASNLQYETSQVFSWNSKSADTVYQALSDGLVVCVFACTAASIESCTGYSDSSNPPTTVVAVASIKGNGTNGFFNTITFPVRKGDYWKILNGGDIAGNRIIYWIPLGTAG